VVCASGVMVALSWVINSVADSLALLYAAAVIAGLGAGPIFAATVGNAMRWFPDRRGLAAGLSAAGFGAGSALTVVPIAYVIQTYGFEAAYLWFGLGQGIVIMVVGLALRAPQAVEVAGLASARVQQTARDCTPAQVLRSAPFWLMYAMFVFVGAGGLTVTAQIAPLAKDFAIENVPVSLLGLTMPALSFALSIGLLANGLSRPFFGWVSDRLGRENTMFFAFLLEGIALFGLYFFADQPRVFVLLAGLVYFAWGEIFALFPATCTDIYGKKFAATNYGMLYTAKGTAALLVPLGSVLTSSTGSWTAVFMVVSAMSVVGAFTALLALKPLRMRAVT
jgi:OFA family oxalate/formate antiporter-like MFS transporter